jgi:hypothetical protein
MRNECPPSLRPHTAALNAEMVPVPRPRVVRGPPAQPVRGAPGHRAQVRPAARPGYGLAVGAVVGDAEAHGRSEPGSVPASVGVHGTLVSIGPRMPPS